MTDEGRSKRLIKRQMKMTDGNDRSKRLIKSVHALFFHIRSMESLIYPAAGEPVSLIICLAPGEPVSLVYPAAGEPVSLIYPAAGEPVSRIYPAAGEPDSLPGPRVSKSSVGLQVKRGSRSLAWVSKSSVGLQVLPEAVSPAWFSKSTCVSKSSVRLQV